MWVKRSAKELAEFEAKKKRDRPRASIFMGVLVFFLYLFVTRDAEEGFQLAHAWEIPGRVAPGLLYGLIFGVIFYLFPTRARQIVVCGSCGKSKDKNSETKCPCGGTFEDIQTIKWQDDAENTTR